MTLFRFLLTLTLTTALAFALPAQAARFQFCWIGNSGYTMRGEIEFPDALLNSGIITESDVTDFRIQGFRDGLPVGFWSLDRLKPTTSWTLRFDTNSLQFPVGGSRALGTYQEWNANGAVDDCGAVNGFGFNGGNWAQDVCINNVWIEDSSIDPFTPIEAFPMDVALGCDPTMQMM